VATTSKAFTTALITQVRFVPIFRKNDSSIQSVTEKKTISTGYSFELKMHYFNLPRLPKAGLTDCAQQKIER